MIGIIQTILLWIIAMCLAEIGIELKRIRKQNDTTESNT